MTAIRSPRCPRTAGFRCRAVVADSATPADEFVPALRVTTLEQVPAPEEPYEY